MSGGRGMGGEQKAESGAVQPPVRTLLALGLESAFPSTGQQLVLGGRSAGSVAVGQTIAGARVEAVGPFSGAGAGVGVPASARRAWYSRHDRNSHIYLEPLKCN